MSTTGRSGLPVRPLILNSTCLGPFHGKPPPPGVAQPLHLSGNGINWRAVQGSSRDERGACLSKWFLSPRRICSKDPKLVGASLLRSSQLDCSWALNIRKEPGQAGVLRQAGTWDPLPRCLHLESPLSQQQNAKKPQRTKSNCTRRGRFWMGRYRKTKTPAATSEEPGAKAGDCACPLHGASPKGRADHPRASSLTPGHTPASLHVRSSARSPWGAAKRPYYPPTLVLHPEQQRRNTAWPEFLAWPLINFYWLRRSRSLVSNSVTERSNGWSFPTRGLKSTEENGNNRILLN